MNDRIRRSLRKRLLSLMEEVSEDHYCAGWLNGLEYRLWQAALQYPQPYKFGVEAIEEKKVEELKGLAEELQEWAVWDDQAGEEKLIPLKDWKRIFAASKTASDSGEEKSDEPET
ncbi:MAG TPA: hypothetical protein VJZ77_16820 [Blastocatellia bacterium]|nr:hypothetical protein [Blastocatellia bacterium]